MSEALAAADRPTRLLIADDHPLILAGVRRALSEVDGFAIVAEVTTGAAVLPQVARTQPDVVLLDVSLPDLDGLTCLERLRARHPGVVVVMFSASADAATIDRARNAGARGFIVKSLVAPALATALADLLGGGEFRVVGGESPSEFGPADLSEREMATLKAVARGLSNKAIARELWISEQTVKFHLTNVYRKLGVDSRTQAARLAFDYGLARG